MQLVSSTGMGGVLGKKWTPGGKRDSGWGFPESRGDWTKPCVCGCLHHW